VRIINVMLPLLEVRGLTVELPTAAGWVRPVNEVSLRISKGESLGLVGESGSGKTMLSLALMGLLPPGARVSGGSLPGDGCISEEIDRAGRRKSSANFPLPTSSSRTACP